MLELKLALSNFIMEESITFFEGPDSLHNLKHERWNSIVVFYWLQHEKFDTELHQKDSRTKPKTSKSRIGSLTTYVVCSLKLTWIYQHFRFWIPSLSFQSLVYILLQDRLYCHFSVDPYLLFSPIFPCLSRCLLEIFLYTVFFLIPL